MLIVLETKQVTASQNLLYFELFIYRGNPKWDANKCFLLVKKKKKNSINSKYPKMLLGCDVFEVSLMSPALDFYKE